MTTPKMAGMTPKMAGLTPNSHAGVGMGTFGFPSTLPGHSPAATLLGTTTGKHRSPLPSASLNSPGMLAALGVVDLRGAAAAAAAMQAAAAAGTGGLVEATQLQPDENKKRELAEILELLASRPGRISIPAVERLAKVMGLYCYKEETDTPGVTRLSLAAKIFLLDIEHSGDKIHHVQLNFENTPGQSFGLSPKAAAIFLANLRPKSRARKGKGKGEGRGKGKEKEEEEKDTAGRTPPMLLSPSLSDFADNLNRLYRTDKLSTSVNCFTAITGIYHSMLRVYEFEKDNMGGEVKALCYGIGRPRMHTRGKVGLSIDYWKERKAARGGANSGGRDTGEEERGGEEGEEGEEDEEGNGRLWRVLIEVEETPPDFGISPGVTPVRATTHWISDEIKKQREDGLFEDIEEFMTDWLEPPLDELMDMAGDPSQPRPPSARFVARLDPPVVLPWQEEHAINPGLMLEPDRPSEALEALVLPGLSHQPENTVYRRIYVPGGGGGGRRGEEEEEGEEGVMHRYQLQNTHLKPVLARQVSEIPFSHPRELLRMFHTLRQYALLTTLLESCFSDPDPVPPPAASATAKDINAFLSDDDDDAGVLAVDVSLEPEHGFGLRLVYPDAATGGGGEGVMNLQLQIGKNADIKALLAGGGGASGVPAESVERALRACEHVGLVLEWIRRQHSRAPT